MIEFKNILYRDDMPNGLPVIRRCGIGMSSVQGGILVEAFVKENEEEHSSSVLLTPMDAAIFIEEMHRHSGKECTKVGEVNHVSVCPMVSMKETAWRICDVPSEAIVFIGGISMVVNSAITRAMRIAAESMMTSLLFPTCM